MTNAAIETTTSADRMDVIRRQNGLCISQMEALGCQAQREDINHLSSLATTATPKGTASQSTPEATSPAPAVVTPEPRRPPQRYPDSSSRPSDVQRFRRDSSRLSLDGSKLRLPRASAAKGSPSPKVKAAADSPPPAKDPESLLAEKDEKLERAIKEIEAGKIALAAERAKTRTLVQKRVDDLAKKHAVEIAELEENIRELESTIKGEQESLKKAAKISDENNTLRVRIRDYESKLEGAKNKIARLETQLKVKDEDVLTSTRLVKNLTEQRDLFKAQLEGLDSQPPSTVLLASAARYEALVGAHKQALESEQKARGEAADLRVKNEAHARETARLHAEVNALKNKIIRDQQDHLAERDRMSETFNQRIEEITREFADSVSTHAEERRRSEGGPTEKLKLRVEELTLERDALLGELEEYRGGATVGDSTDMIE